MSRAPLASAGFLAVLFLAGAGLAETHPVDPEVHELYLQGRRLREEITEEALWKSVECFERALERDPEYAPAHAGLAGSYLFLGTASLSALTPRQAYPKAKAAAMRALELDDNLAEAHCYLGSVHMQYDWDWAAAEREFERAIELDPSSALAHACSIGPFLLAGRHAETMARARRARELDPLSHHMNTTVAFMYCWAGEYDRAMEEARTALAIAPDHWHTRWCIAWIYLSQAMYDEAIAKFEETLELSGQGIDVLAALGNAYGAAGRREEALEILDRLNQRAKQGYVPSAAFAQVYAGLGEKDEAFAWLEKAYEERSPWLLHVWLPTFASLHSDPRYEDLLRRMGHPKSRAVGEDEH